MKKRSVKVKEWSHKNKPDEAVIRRLMKKKGLRAYLWSNEPGDVYAAHTHTYHKVLYVVSGSITFGLPDKEQEIKLKVGDRLDLPPHIVHNAVVGPEGVVCLEAHR